MRKGAPRGRSTAPRLGLGFVGVLIIGVNLRPAITSVGPLLGDIRTDLGLSGTAASVLMSIPILAFALAAPVAPVLARRLSIERTLWASLVLLAVGIVVRSLPVEPLLWVGTVALGIAIAFGNVVLPALVKRDYPRHVGQVTGAYIAVTSVAASLASGLAVPIAGQTSAGWRLALGVWVGLAVVAIAVFAPQIRHREERRERPATSTQPTQSDERPLWRSALAWQVTAFMGLQSGLFYILLTWVPSMVQSFGNSAVAAGWHLFALQLIGVGANLAVAALIPRLRDQRLLCLGATALIGVGLVGLLLAPSAALLWMLFIGSGTGSSFVLALSLFGLRSHDHQQAARLSGMGHLYGYLFTAAGPIVIGAVFDATGSWTLPLVLLLGLVVLQGTAASLAGRNITLGHPGSRTASRSERRWCSSTRCAHSGSASADS